MLALPRWTLARHLYVRPPSAGALPLGHDARCPSARCPSARSGQVSPRAAPNPARRGIPRAPRGRLLCAQMAICPDRRPGVS